MKCYEDVWLNHMVFLAAISHLRRKTPHFAKKNISQQQGVLFQWFGASVLCVSFIFGLICWGGVGVSETFDLKEK